MRNSRKQVRTPSTLTLKFSTTLKDETEIDAAKDRLAAYQKKDWFLMEGRESLLTYSDKKGIDLSLKKRFLNFAKRIHTERIKSTMDVRGGVIAVIALFVILVGIDVFLGEAAKCSNI